MSTPRITVSWTSAALESLRGLPAKVQRGLLDKADALAAAGDPRRGQKPLVGPLQGCYRMTYGRYGAIYTVREQKNGGLRVQIAVIFLLAGTRKEHSKDDVYRLAEKIIALGVVGDPLPRGKR